jgi:hypothetical protein
MAYAGIAYQPATGAWRRLPSIASLDEGNFEGGSDVVWAGSEAFLAGLINGAYGPAANHWRRLPAMGTGRMWHSAVWTGRRLLVWGGRTFDAGAWTAPAHGLAYDPVANRWSPLPKSPLRGRFGHVAVWTGTRLLIWGGHPARQTGPERPFTDGAAYTPYPL